MGKLLIGLRWKFNWGHVSEAIRKEHLRVANIRKSGGSNYRNRRKLHMNGMK